MNRLQFPLNNFWVSEPYTFERGYIGLGKLEEDTYSRTVVSSGYGTVVKVEGTTLQIECKAGDMTFLIEYINIDEILVREGDYVKRGEPIGTLVRPHMRIRIYSRMHTGKFSRVNPMRVLYTVPGQKHRNHVPRHFPKPLPIRFL